MLVIVEADAVSVAEPDELRSLAVSSHLSAEQTATVLFTTGFGAADIEGNACWLRVGVLRSAANRDADEAWQREFESMIGYAASLGWVRDDGRLVRAHITNHT